MLIKSILNIFERHSTVDIMQPYCFIGFNLICFHRTGIAPDELAGVAVRRRFVLACFKEYFSFLRKKHR